MTPIRDLLSAAQADAWYDGNKFYANEESASMCCADMSNLQTVFTLDTVEKALAPVANEFPYEAACSGLRYSNAKACGEVTAIWLDGMRYELSAKPAQQPADAELLAVAKAVKDLFAERYQFNLDAGCSPMSGNLDWIRLEGAVAVVQAIERAIKQAESAQDGKVCPDKARMGEHACSNPSQCFEPCGQLGHSAEHAQRVCEWRCTYDKGDGPCLYSAGCQPFNDSEQSYGDYCQHCGGKIIEPGTAAGEIGEAG